MICSLDELRQKEVIDISDGERLGYIDDVQMDVSDARIKSLMIYGRQRLFGLLGREEDVLIPCCDIRVIGTDVILVKRSICQKLTEDSKNEKSKHESLFK